MKKQWLYLLLLVLLIPFVKAAITIEGPSKTIYNLGDKLDIKATIIEQEAIQGLLKLELNCETPSPLLIRTINLKQNEKYTLTENLPIPPLIIGACSIISSIQVADIVYDQSQSSTFTISNELLGDLKIDKTEAQLGEKIILSGTITKQDSSLLDGIANIYFKTNENIVSMNTLEIKKGSINYEFDTIPKPVGTYTITIEASDIYGNKYSSSDLTFNLIGQLSLDLQLDKTETLPDSTIKLSGTVKDIKNNLVKDGKVTITLEDQIYITEVSSGSFSQKITIPKTIKSGVHTIHVKVEDNFGNTAEKEIQFSVTPVPTALEIKTSQESLKPESTFLITAFVYDQAADKINEKTKLEVLNPKKEKVLEKEVSNEEEINVEIPQSASPGLWTITGFAAGLKTKKQITVEEVSSISTSLEGQSIKITNTGNINYKEPISITFKDNENTISEAIKPGFFGIKPTAFAVYDLGKYVKTGTYDVSINNQEFEGISITKTRSWFSIFYLIPIAIIIVFLIFLFISKNLKTSHKKDKDFQKGKELGEKIRSQKPPMTDAQLKQKYRNEFMGHMLKKVEERDKDLKKQLRFDFSSKKEPPMTFASVKLPKKESSSSIFSTVQKPAETQPLWRILRKKGLAKDAEKEKKEFKPKDPGLFSMFD